LKKNNKICKWLKVPKWNGKKNTNVYLTDCGETIDFGIAKNYNPIREYSYDFCYRCGKPMNKKVAAKIKERVRTSPNK
jgi:hypothetical protein